MKKLSEPIAAISAPPNQMADGEMLSFNNPPISGDMPREIPKDKE